MDFDWSIKLGLILILLLCSAFFSGSEVALFSLDQKKLDSSFNKTGIIYRYLLSLINSPRRLLVTILIGNTVVNVSLSIISVSIAFDFAKHFNYSIDIILSIQILIVTILILLFGELYPKVLASKNPIKFAKIIAIPLNICSIIIYPVAESLTEIIKLSSTKLSFDKTKSALTKEELVDLANIGKEKGTIVEDEHSLISSIVAFSSLSVDEVMTPRVDMVAVSITDSYENIVKIITESGHSRIPVYKNNIDEIVGIIFAKDLLIYIKKPGAISDFKINDLLKKPLFIPETKLINELLREFQEKKIHLAIVVDEYGGTSGLISLEDIIEEVIGEIWDEFDKEENPISKLNDSQFLVLGKAKLDEINEQLNTSIIFDQDGYDTIGGYILHKVGNIPKEGFSFQENGLNYTVKEIHKKRIKKVIIEKINSSSNN